jgi:hypothetical protein
MPTRLKAVSPQEYLTEIQRMRKKGPWKLPMGFGDYVQFWLLSLLIHWNWFSHFFFGFIGRGGH